MNISIMVILINNTNRLLILYDNNLELYTYIIQWRDNMIRDSELLF